MKTILFTIILLFSIIMGIFFIDILRSLIQHTNRSYLVGIESSWLNLFCISILLIASIYSLIKNK